MMASSRTKGISLWIFTFSACLILVSSKDDDEDKYTELREDFIIEERIQLKYLSQQYVPYDYEQEEDSLHAKYGVDMNAVDVSALDVMTGLVYTAGKNYIHVVDYSKATNPSIQFKKEYKEEVSDVEVCDSMVAFLIDGNPGRVDIFNVYDKEKPMLELNVTIDEVGMSPSAMIFDEECKKLVVANEGSPYEDSDGKFVDPEGTVAIIDLEAKSPTPSILDFTKFNDRSDEFLANGVRWPFPNQTTFSQSLEPESLTLNTEVKTIVFVSLQENNAIAQVDILGEGVIEYIHALGAKSWEIHRMDASDADGGINLWNTYDIHSLYQPDGITFFEVDGQGYIAAADEGETMELMKDGMEYSEVQRGREFVENDQLDDSISAELKEALADDSQLGRLEFSKFDGINKNTSKFDKLHFFGSRGISVFLASDMSLVYHSGPTAEFLTALLYPKVFNADLDATDDSKKPSDFMDVNSPSKGPEVESIEGGEYNGTRVLFAGIESLSAIMVFSFAEGAVEPRFESIHRRGGVDESFSKLLDDQNLGDLDPEELKFIPAEYSSTGGPLLLVTGTFSGTLAMYEITRENWEEPANFTPGVLPVDSGMGHNQSYGFMVLVTLVIAINMVLSRF